MLFRPGEVGCNLDGSRTLSTSPVVLHIVRPYATVEEYLAAEAWTIDTRAMVLVDAADLAPDTAILFDVAIGSGEKLIRAEGKVAAKIAQSTMIAPAGVDGTATPIEAKDSAADRGSSAP